MGAIVRGLACWAMKEHKTISTRFPPGLAQYRRLGVCHVLGWQYHPYK